MSESTNAGHRQRLRERFLSGEAGSRTDEALLELLLTYAIPQKDVQPLAKQLLAAHGDLLSVLEAPIESLCRTEGIKAHSAALIKLAEWMRQPGTLDKTAVHSVKTAEKQLPLLAPREQGKLVDTRHKKKAANHPRIFTKVLLQEAVNMLPQLPDSDSLEEIRAFLRAKLHFSAEQTRQRYANYITGRMFADGHADEPLRMFAKAFPNTQELREVCFYRFMRAEPLEMEIVEDLLLPNIGAGKVAREMLRKRLQEKFPTSRSIMYCGQAAVEALVSGGIAKADAKTLSFTYRDIPFASFAFVLHSEFPEPGMFDVGGLEMNRLIRAMLWNPERLLYTLYELRNQGLISKISEIDGIRQFTTKYTVAGVVEQLAARRAASKAAEFYPAGEKRP